MTALVKLVSLLVVLSFFIYESSLLYVDNFSFQIICLCVVLLACLIRFGKSKMLNEIRLMLPFILTMLCVYLLLSVLGIKVKGSNNSVFMYWLKYGSNRTILFINTMFFIQVLLSYISIQDILSLPMKMAKKRYLLLGRALFVHSIKYIEALEFHLKLMPEYQKTRLTFLQWFRFKLQLSLAVIMMVLRESKVKGELIDNRIIHCFREQTRSAK